MSEVKADAVNISKLLKGKKYLIEDYQREYRWEEKHITDLIEDLTEKFLNSNGKDHYFLGSIIISNRDGKNFIIDGQQRLTSLTLLLIYIYRTLKDQKAPKEELRELICSKEKGFNISVARRRECMRALLRHGKLSEKQSDESIKNIVERYENIDDNFPGHLAGEPNTPSDELELLPDFADWLITEVYLVQITADSDADAYAVFETLNARGLSLTPTEMLKGYLLTKGPKDKEIRSDLNEKWKELISKLQSIGKGEDADAIKAWLRSQYAQPHKGTEPRDFDKIGSGFHRWVRDKVRKKELDGFDPNKKDSFFDFITRDFRFYGKWYKFIRKVAVDFNLARKENVETIHYNFHIWHALWYMLLLAPLNKSDSDEGDNIIRCKLQIVSSFLDILIARRLWNGNANGRDVSSNTMRDMIIRLTQEIRGKSISELITILTSELGKTGQTFESNETLALHGRNRSHIRYLLARMTDYVETSSDLNRLSHFHEYMYMGYEVEHIWAEKKYKEHGYENKPEFLEHRNRIGGLLLLPKRRNGAYNDDSYDEKRKYYGEGGENLLVRSLHEGAYQRDPFKDFNDEFERNSGLKFQHHDDFTKDALNARQKLYRELCKQIWDPKKLRDLGEEM